MSKLQKIIVPRNWLFGRLAGISNNLRGMISGSKVNFTKDEILKLKIAYNTIYEIISLKQVGSDELKRKLRRDEEI